MESYETSMLQKEKGKRLAKAITGERNHFTEPEGRERWEGHRATRLKWSQKHLISIYYYRSNKINCTCAVTSYLVICV